MQIRHFRRFRRNGPFLAGDKNTVFQKHGLCHPENWAWVQKERMRMDSHESFRYVRESH